MTEILIQTDTASVEYVPKLPQITVNYRKIEFLIQNGKR